jgi:photosystem II stability/assembly factor-like uncharacterized protein
MRGSRFRRGAFAIAVALGLATCWMAPAIAAPPRHDWHVTATLALGADDTAVSCAGTRCWSLEAGQLLSSIDAGATWSSERAAVPDGIAALNDVDCPGASVCYFLATTDAQQSVVLIERHGELDVHDLGATTPWISISCAGPQHCVATDGFSSFSTRNGWDSFSTRPFAQALYGTADIGCTTGTNTCAAVGDFGETPRIEYTSNDGETWTPQTVPTPSDGMYAVACPTTRTCYAGGADFSDHAIVLSTTDAGAHWNFASLSAFQPYPVRSISCTDATTCLAVGDTPGNSPFVFATTDGAQWDRQSIDAIGSEQRAQVSCASATQCAIVEGGTAFATTDGGASWPHQPIPSALEAPRAMACPSPTHCLALSNDATGLAQIIVSDDGGTTWSPQTLAPDAGAPMDVACPALGACLATTRTQADGGPPVTRVWLSTDGGITWKAGHLQHPRGELGRLACANTKTCLVVGSDSHYQPKAEATTDGGRTWHETTTPAGIVGIEGAACSAPDACVLIGAFTNAAPQAFTTTNLGASYDAHPLPNVDGNSYLLDVDCARRTCLAVGSTSGNVLIERSTDRGLTWKASTLPEPIDSALYVDCVSPVRCAMTAYDYNFETGGPVVALSRNGGRTWRVEHIPARNEEPLGLACHADGCIASDISPSANPIILAGSF